MFNMYRRISPYVIIPTTVYELERGYIVNSRESFWQ